MLPADDDKVEEKSQSQRFIETARSLGCDEDEEAFKAKLGKVARAKPEKAEPNSKK